MVNPARGWCSLHRVALVVVGWLLFASALVTANPLLKGLFLVAARALPQALWDRSRIGPHLSLDCPRRASTSVGSRRLTPRVSPCLSAFGRRVPTMVCGVSCVRIPLGRQDLEASRCQRSSGLPGARAALPSKLHGGVREPREVLPEHSSPHAGPRSPVSRPGSSPAGYPAASGRRPGRSLGRAASRSTQVWLIPHSRRVRHRARFPCTGSSRPVNWH